MEVKISFGQTWSMKNPLDKNLISLVIIPSAAHYLLAKVRWLPFACQTRRDEMTAYFYTQETDFILCDCKFLIYTSLTTMTWLRKFISLLLKSNEGVAEVVYLSALLCCWIIQSQKTQDVASLSPQAHWFHANQDFGILSRGKFVITGMHLSMT